MFAEWPVTEGHVVSVTKTEKGVDIMYDFEYGGRRLGGTSTLKIGSPAAEYSPGQAIAVHYDPLNPDRSKLIQ